MSIDDALDREWNDRCKEEDDYYRRRDRIYNKTYERWLATLKANETARIAIETMKAVADNLFFIPPDVGTLGYVMCEAVEPDDDHLCYLDKVQRRDGDKYAVKIHGVWYSGDTVSEAIAEAMTKLEMGED